MRKHVMTMSAAVFLAAVGQASAAWPPAFDNVYQAGLIDAEHTLSDGSKYSDFFGLNASGRVIGSSRRYTYGLLDPDQINNPGGVLNETTAWTWTFATGTVTLGFTDAEHTGASNQRNSTAYILNNGGYVGGTSNRYAGDTLNGQSSWVWSSGIGSTRVGLIDTTHTGLNNYQYSTISKINNAGRAIGNSNVFDSTGNVGANAWTWTQPTGTIALGLTDIEHTRSDGLSNGNVNELNEAGRVTGYSSRFAGMDDVGITPWTWSEGGGTTPLGFTDVDHTRSDGYRFSFSTNLSSAGRVAGYSQRYTGAPSGSPGNSTWTWSQSDGQTRIGLTDAAHTSSTGLQSSLPSGILAGDRVVGGSVRYSGTDSNGNSAWVWSAPTGTTRIGLFDANHTNPLTGTQVSFIGGNNSSSVDRAIGASNRYGAAGNDLGLSSWVWSPSGPFAGTTRIGLTTDSAGSGSTRSDGYQLNTAITVNTSGRVAGTAWRFSNGATEGGSLGTGGQSVWTWNPSTGVSMRIGLTAAPYSGGGSLQYSEFGDMNEAGQIVGTSIRYQSASSTIARGIGGWFYDPATGITSPLVFSTGLQNRAGTTPMILTEGGLVLGTYLHYAFPTSTLPDATNAFIWSSTNGFTDLGNLVNGGLSAWGVSLLTEIVGANELSEIVALGRSDGTSSSSQSVFVLAIPAPASAALLGLSGLVVTRRRRIASR